MEQKHIGTKNKLGEGHTFKISRFKEQIKKTRPHKHDEYYELIFLAEGQGFHSIESEKYLISSPEVYLLKPGQLHFWQFTSIPKGFVIIYRENEFDPVNEKRLLDMLRELQAMTRLRLTRDRFPLRLLEAIFTEYQLNAPYSNDIIHGLLKSLVGSLLRLNAATAPENARPQSVYERFIVLLNKECPRLHRVNEFAELVNTTPQNLNSLCRKQSGKSAGELIAHQLLLEAKRYILHTDNTINEIAEILAFTDTSNFVKFFKRYEQVTPLQFRRKYFQ